MILYNIIIIHSGIYQYIITIFAHFPTFWSVVQILTYPISVKRAYFSSSTTFPPPINFQWKLSDIFLADLPKSLFYTSSFYNKSQYVIFHVCWQGTWIIVKKIIWISIYLIHYRKKDFWIRTFTEYSSMRRYICIQEKEKWK